MISDLDETIRQILLHDGQLDPSQVDVSFEIPDSEWASGISKPTLNCYLFDIRENRELLTYGVIPPEKGKPGGLSRMRPPLCIDLTYLITAWTRAVEDEHNLLWQVLATLIRCGTLPPERLQGMLRELQRPINSSIGKSDGVLKSPGEFWTALENKIKPSLSFVVTLMLDRDSLPAGPPVQEPKVRVRASLPIRGFVRDPQGAPLAGARVALDEPGSVPVVTAADGSFLLYEGARDDATLRITAGELVRQVTIGSCAALYIIMLDLA